MAEHLQQTAQNKSGQGAFVSNLSSLFHSKYENNRIKLRYAGKICFIPTIVALNGHGREAEYFHLALPSTPRVTKQPTQAGSQ